MATRGRKPAAPRENLLAIFNETKGLIIRENALLPATDIVWRNIIAEHSIKMSAKAIQESARKWHMLENPRKRSRLEIEPSSDSGSSSDSNCSSKSVEHSDDNICCTINMSPHIWKTIQPVEKHYRRELEKNRSANVRIYKTLQQGVWSTVLFDLIRKDEKLKEINCCWMFKRAKVCIHSTRICTEVEKCILDTSCFVYNLSSYPDKRIGKRLQNYYQLSVLLFALDGMNNNVKATHMLRFTTRAKCSGKRFQIQTSARLFLEVRNLEGS